MCVYLCSVNYKKYNFLRDSPFSYCHHACISIVVNPHIGGYRGILTASSQVFPIQGGKLIASNQVVPYRRGKQTAFSRVYTKSLPLPWVFLQGMADDRGKANELQRLIETVSSQLTDWFPAQINS